jgi:D-threo-aldose 1-dehydrogenase
VLVAEGMSQSLLPGTGIETSRLGFGCAVLGGRLSTRTKRRLLETAFDAGITHFDVARLYGHGEAERHLGAFLRPRRDSVTVTTKVGLLPPGGPARLRLVRAGRRLLGSPTAGVRRFAVADVRSSVEASLNKLGTDHVDLLLLHDCRPDDVTEDLVELLDDCIRRGLTRATGIATGVGATAALLERERSFPSVIQIPFSVLDGGRSPFPPAIVHSVLAQDLPRMRKVLSVADARAARWSRTIGVDCSDAGSIAQFVLACALDVSANRIVLFSSQHPERVRANAEVLSRPPLTPDLRAALAAMRAELNAGDQPNSACAAAE